MYLLKIQNTITEDNPITTFVNVDEIASFRYKKEIDSTLIVLKNSETLAVTGDKTLDLSRKLARLDGNVLTLE